MRLVGQIHVTVRGDVVTRDPSLLERLGRRLGARVNLETDEVKNGLEATAVVDAVRRALGKLGVTNALSLVIDDTVIFQDTEGKRDDLPDLVIALSEHTSLFGRGFHELRFAAEHDEAGLRLIVETRARTRHKRDEPAAIVSVGARILALEPRPGEAAEQYRARVEPLTKDAAVFEVTRHAFQSFMQRLEGVLRAELPDADVAEKKTEARLVRAPDRAVAPADKAADRPLAPGYDPYQVYYPSPMGLMLDAMIFSSFMHMMSPPSVLLVSPGGAPLGTVADVQANPELASDDRVAEADHQSDSDDSPDDWDSDAVESGGGDDFGGGDDGGFDGGSFD
jgi:hypothetical protein